MVWTMRLVLPTFKLHDRITWVRCNVELKDALEFLDKHCCNKIKILLHAVLAPLARSVWTSFPGPGLTGWQNWFTIQKHGAPMHAAWDGKIFGCELGQCKICRNGRGFGCCVLQMPSETQRFRLQGDSLEWLSGVPVHWLLTCKTFEIDLNICHGWQAYQKRLFFPKVQEQDLLTFSELRQCCCRINVLLQSWEQSSGLSLWRTWQR